jgi:hypothetical protein
VTSKIEEILDTQFEFYWELYTDSPVDTDAQVGYPANSWCNVIEILHHSRLQGHTIITVIDNLARRKIRIRTHLFFVSKSYLNKNMNNLTWHAKQHLTKQNKMYILINKYNVV